MPKPQHVRWRGPRLGGGSHDTKIRRLEDPLDIWLKQELTKLYAGVLEEPLPPALTELLREYEKRLQQQPDPEPEKESLER